MRTTTEELLQSYPIAQPFSSPVSTAMAPKAPLSRATPCAICSPAAPQRCR